MRGLNEWLERDVQDRQAELRGVTARVDELRNDIARLGLGIQPGVQPPGVHPTMHMPEPRIPHGVIPVGPIPPPPIIGQGPPLGFVPHGGLEPPVIPDYEGSPQPGQYTPRTMYNTLRRIQCYTWDQVINKIYLPSYIPGLCSILILQQCRGVVCLYYLGVSTRGSERHRHVL
ncbi:hypothetical protein CY34DRAFT_9962 [Suillus luteus UH-Slu-Lm8-n1]|uniref:Uncharacterized protein n=1 Tax=Suillus luteus UH-Slu-Lm8-n1 TaxID=930992 RepID=A0A0D0A7G3_9AGAM|nr:hypothetical protein CY34DRAFT_9962 [Suillus luteus UH-Slu-Lm8-n1]